MLIVRPASWATASPSADLFWAQSRDGQTLTAQGCDPVALLPPDTETVLVLPVLAASWHRVSLPKIATSRLRLALDGLLEDRLLAEPAQLHMAVQPAAQTGQPAWVCACDKAMLLTWLALLDAHHRPAARIVPDQVPQPETEWTALTAGADNWWVQAGPKGVWPLPLGPVAPTGMTSDDAPATHTVLRAEPACASAAEAAVGRPVQLETPAQRLLRSAQSGWNLAQFDIKRSAHNRRNQQLLHSLGQLAYAPAWRATRWGLLAAATSALAGLGAAAWTEHDALAAKRQAVQALLQHSFPDVSLVLDAPLQMQREVDRLQRSHGSASDADLDKFLSDFSASALDGIDLRAIQFSTTNIIVTLTSAADSQVPALQTALQRKGWRSQWTAPTLTLTRALPAASPTLPARL